ncbi:MAG: hypothetical protein MR413_05930 [Clostridia bacterium]|nr:hypothetical protein [Clostridia bacterium]
MKRTDFENQFKNPDNIYRSIPFWAWNDKLNAEEIRRQIYEMHSNGIGGFFIHSRDGLETEYLGSEWFECVKTAVNTAKELGMYAWLYDEDRWPSGSCGGAVTKNMKNACKGLTLEVCDEVPDKIDGDILAIYLANVKVMDIYSLKRLDTADNIKLKKGEVLLIARLETSEGSEWFNYSPPPDNLSADTVDEFIHKTHDVYKRNIGDEFGKTIPGIFTDEPSLADRHCSFNPKRGWIPWTYGFGEYFCKNCGYDPLDTIPYLYFNHEKSRKIRFDYWKTVSQRFKEVYSEKISKWCRENNLLFTGHFLQEDKLGLSCRVNGSIMPHYISQNIPAIDMLTERTEEYMTVKQCASVASQTGKDMVISETYGCTGWDFSFEGQKWVGDWQYVLGVNQRCQHLALYSLRGCRKRDYPPSINCNTSWWKNYKTVEDYFARCGFMLRRGSAIRKVLLIHPMSTVWSKVGCDPYGNPKRGEERDIPSMNRLGERYNLLIKNLCKHHYDCDLGDEVIINDYGRCENSEFCVGECSYTTVIVPMCENLLSSTVKKLIDFMDKDGTVLGISPFTDYVDGEKSDEAFKLINHKNFIKFSSEEALLDYMQGNIDKAVSITDDYVHEEKNILYQLRCDDDGYILFVVNNDRRNPHTANISLKIDNGTVYHADLLSGDIKRVKSEVKNGRIYFSDYMPGCASSMFYISKADNILCDENMDYDNGKSEHGKREKVIALTLTDYKNDMPNILTLDKCIYRLDGEILGKNEVWKAQCDIRERLDMRQIHRNGIEQRYRWINKPHRNDNREVIMEFEIKALADVLKPKLIIERPECFEISLDEEKINNTVCGYFMDKEFKAVNLLFIGKGVHKLTLKCNYKNDMELENCYIIGEFAVNARREICEKPEALKMGSITKQGYLHYAGGIDYIFSCNVCEITDEMYLDVREFKGTCVTAEINGIKIPVPWKADAVIKVSKLVKLGENKIVISVFGSPRNMIGPLHITNKPLVTKDSCFCPDGDNYTEEYMTSDIGLLETPTIYYRDKM